MVCVYCSSVLQILVWCRFPQFLHVFIDFQFAILWLLNQLKHNCFSFIVRFLTSIFFFTFMHAVGAWMSLQYIQVRFLLFKSQFRFVLTLNADVCVNSDCNSYNSWLTYFLDCNIAELRLIATVNSICHFHKRIPYFFIKLTTIG